MIRKGIYLTKEILKAVDVYREPRGITESEAIRRLLEEKLDVKYGLAEDREVKSEKSM